MKFKSNIVFGHAPAGQAFGTRYTATRGMSLNICLKSEIHELRLNKIIIVSNPSCKLWVMF